MERLLNGTLVERPGVNEPGASHPGGRLEPGELVAFCSGPSGAHTVHGPGGVLMFFRGRARLG